MLQLVRELWNEVVAFSPFPKSGREDRLYSKGINECSVGTRMEEDSSQGCEEIHR